MQVTGFFNGITQDWETGKACVTFKLNERFTQAMLDEIKDSKLSIEIEQYKEKRSLDSNAYAWVLMQKIAEATNSDKWTVYLQCLQDYSRAFTHVVVKPEAVDRMKQLYRTCVDLGEITVNGQSGHQLQVYYGSSTFNTKEMSVFIDGIVSECKQLGIETMPPEQLARLKAMWGAKKNG